MSNGVAFGLQACTQRYGQFAIASGQFHSRGDAQSCFYTARNLITHSDANWHRLYLDGVSENQKMWLSIDTIWTFIILLQGTTANGGKVFSYKIEGMAANKARTTTIKALTVTTIFTDDASFDAQVIVDGSYLIIEVKDADAAGDSVRWTSRIITVESSWQT